jgi:hypothetical protein
MGGDYMTIWIIELYRFSEAIRLKVERLSDGALSYEIIQNFLFY